MTSRNPTTRRKRTMLTQAAMLAIIVPLAASPLPALAAQAKAVSLNIEAQPLAEALMRLSRQARIDIAASADLTRGRRAPALSGAMTAEQALQRLLVGSGLTFRAGRGNSYVVEKAAAVSTQSETSEASDAAAGLADDNPEAEIVVTASKREERLRDVPASISAITGETLINIGATRMEDYITRVPGLILDNTSFSNGANQLTIRGLNTGNGGNPTVGIYIDESPYGGSSNNSFGGSTVPDLDPMDLARIEVLRGPQGTLYGAGSLGGLFKYVTAAPDPSHFYGRVQADGSSIDGGGSGFGLRGAANIPLGDVAAIRASGLYRSDPGFIDNVTTGERNVNDSRVYGGRLAVGVELGENWKLTASALLQRQKSDGNAIVDHNNVTFEPKYGPLAQARAPGTGRTASFIGVYGLTLEGDLGFATLTSATSYNRQTVDFNLDVSAPYSPLLAQNGIPGAGVAIVTDAGLKKFTQEVRLTSPTSNILSWQLGAFYTNERSTTHQYFDPFAIDTGEELPFAVPALLDAFVRHKFEEIAAFGNVTYHFSPSFDVTAGIRYSHNSQRRRQTNEGIFIGTGQLDSSSSDNSVTYLVTPRLKLGDDTMVYARVASGYRPGGPNNPVPGTPASYGPDRVTNYEVGLKTALLDRKLTLDLAAYWIDWTDIQLNLRNPQGLNFNGNGGKARSRGVEAALSWRPVRGLTIDGNVSYNDAELAEDLPPGLAVASDGDRLPSVPKWSGQISGDYEFPIGGDWRGLAGASWRYIDDRIGYFTNGVAARYPLPSYSVGDLRLGVRNDRLSVTAFIKNVGDSHGQVAAYVLGPDTRVSVIQPRTFGISVASTF